MRLLLRLRRVSCWYSSHAAPTSTRSLVTVSIEALVRGDDRALLLVPGGDDLVEDGADVGVGGQVAELVEDEQVALVVGLEDLGASFPPWVGCPATETVPQQVAHLTREFLAHSSREFTRAGWRRSGRPRRRWRPRPARRRRPRASRRTMPARRTRRSATSRIRSPTPSRPRHEPLIAAPPDLGTRGIGRRRRFELVE